MPPASMGWLTARGFLGGSDLSPLVRLEKEMLAAAAAQRYEEAAVVRDRWEMLANLHEQLQRFREAQRRYNFIYPVSGHQGGCSWYFIRRGQVCLAIDEPRNRRAARECLAAIARIYADDAPPAADAPREDVEMTLMVASWFRSRPEELQRTLSPEGIAPYFHL